MQTKIIVGLLASLGFVYGELVYGESGSLPIPPFQELSNQRPSLQKEELSIFSKGTLEETISSLEKLRKNPSLPYYKAHMEELCTEIFQKLIESKDYDSIIMTLHATALSNHPLSRLLSHELLKSESPVVQLTAIQALSVLNTYDSESILSEALRSDYPLVRIEAGWHIAQKKGQNAFFHLDALSQKLPDELMPYMPELFAIEGSSASLHKIQQYLYHPQNDVTIEALCAIGRYNISSLSKDLPSFQSHSKAILEALAFALRSDSSQETIDRLHELTKHEDPSVRLQASLSLSYLKDSSYQNQISSLIQEGNAFALLAEESSIPAIPSSLFPTNPTTAESLNLAFHLLGKRDDRATPFVKKLLSLSDDYAITPSYSPGHTLFSWDIASLESFPQDMQGPIFEQTLSIKEKALVSSLELSESSFLEIASFILQNRLLDLYPTLFDLLENKQSPTILKLLEDESMRPGAPYNRHFATLCQIRLHTKPSTKAALSTILDFSRKQEHNPWRIPLPWMMKKELDYNSLQERASCKLYLLVIQTLAQEKDPLSIDLLAEELPKAPKYFLPFLAAALLQTTL